MWIFSKYTENFENCKSTLFPLLRKNDYFLKNKRVNDFSVTSLFLKS